MVNHETYKQLLRQVQGRIRTRAANDFKDLLWQVPPLVPGRPVFKPSHAARYITDKLRLGGFQVTPAAPGSADVHMLYITWMTEQKQQQRQPQPPPKKSRAAAAQPPAGGTVSVAEAARRLERLKARLAL